MADGAILPQVKNALIKEGWTVSDEPFTIEYESDRFYADIYAFREEAGTARRVVIVEVKTFGSPSPMREF